MNQIPVIRISLESMKYEFCRMLNERQIEIDDAVKAAVDGYCTPENLQRVLEQSVKQSLDAAIAEEVASFYRYGKGRQVLRAAIEAKLSGKDE